MAVNCHNLHHGETSCRLTGETPTPLVNCQPAQSAVPTSEVTVAVSARSRARSPATPRCTSVAASTTASSAVTVPRLATSISNHYLLDSILGLVDDHDSSPSSPSGHSASFASVPGSAGASLITQSTPFSVTDILSPAEAAELQQRAAQQQNFSLDSVGFTVPSLVDRVFMAGSSGNSG